MKPCLDSHSNTALRGLAVVVVIVWLLPGLVGHEPWKPDEAYTFGLVHHIVESGDWVVPRLAGEPFMEKPPLYFIVAAWHAQWLEGWLGAPDAARLTSAWFMALTLLCVGLAARRLNGPGSGWCAVLLLVATLGLVVRAHQLLTDVAMLSGIAVAFLGLTWLRVRWLLGGLLLGTGAGVAFMSKGLLGPGLLGVGVAGLLLHPGWRRRETGYGLLIALLAAAPWLLIWPLALYQRSPELFHQWFWVNNLGRFTGQVHLGPRAEPWFYPRLLLWSALPLLPLGAYALWRAGWRGLFAQERLWLPAISALGMVIVLSLAADARALYALPLYIPLTVLAVPGLQALSERAIHVLNRTLGLFFGLAVVLFWGLWAVAVAEWPESWYRLLSRKHPVEVLEPSWWILPAAVATLIWLWIQFKTPLDRPPQLALRMAAGVAVLWALPMTLLLPVIDAEKSYRSMCLELGEALPRHYHCISGVLLGEPQRALFEHYLGLHTHACPPRHPDPECELVLVQEHDLEGRPHADFGTLIWRGQRPGDDREHYALYRLSGAGSASE